MSRSSLCVRPIAPGEWAPYRDLRLSALLDAPDAFGSTHAAERLRPDALWAERLYRRHGFVPVGAPAPLREGSSVMAQTMHCALAAQGATGVRGVEHG